MTYNKFKDFKYLSIFTERIVPQFWQQKYPKMTLFIKYFFQYLEQNYTSTTGLDKNGIYYDISHIMDFVDIDAIGRETNIEKKQALLDRVYAQYLGSVNAKAISELITDENEIEYIKNQKYVNSRKGLKANFMYFFLLILGGYFKITDVNYLNKLHDGTFNYDGLINYDNTILGIVPYVYVVISEFNASEYSELMKNLNPAGMKYVTLTQVENEVDDGSINSASTLYNSSNLYFAVYQSTTLVGIIKPTRIKYCTVNETGNSDVLMQSGKWVGFSVSPTVNIFVECVFNSYTFTGTTFNNVKLVNDPLISGNPATDLYYDGSLVSSIGTIVYPQVNMSKTFTIDNNTNIRLLIENMA